MRTALLCIGAALIAIGALLGATRMPGAAQALGLGLVLVIALLVERWRYRNPADRAGGSGWIRTGECFQDPASGEILGVEYRPATGERRYTRRDNSVNSLPDQRYP